MADLSPYLHEWKPSMTTVSTVVWECDHCLTASLLRPAETLCPGKVAALVKRLQSYDGWDGLMRHLNEVYPEDLFGHRADPGDQIVALTRLVDKQRADVSRLTADLAECYRLSGADPSGGLKGESQEDWRLAEDAVREVRRMREEWEADEDRCCELEDEVGRLRRIMAAYDRALNAMEDRPALVELARRINEEVRSG